MLQILKTLKYEWRDVTLRAVIGAIVTIALLWGLAILVGNRQDDQIRRNSEVARIEAHKTRELLCDILIAADNPDIREAVRKHCNGS